MHADVCCAMSLSAKASGVAFAFALGYLIPFTRLLNINYEYIYWEP